MRQVTHFTSLLLDRLELASVLGEGSFGKVYRAFDRALKRDVAVKEFAGRDPSFKTEMEILSRLQHPNLVKVFDLLLDESTGNHYLVQELIVGENVSRYFRRVSGDDRWEVLTQFLRGLEYLHQRGIVHSDIKPSNILVSVGSENGRPQAKLLDFGIAEKIGRRGSEGEFSGTIPYVAPEVIRGEVIDGRADLYSLGMLLFEVIKKGRAEDTPLRLGEQIREALARQAPRAAEFAEGTPELLRDIVTRLLQPDPQVRFRTANHVIRYINRNLVSSFAVEPGRMRLPDRATAMAIGREREMTALQQTLETFFGTTKRAYVAVLLGDAEQGKTAVVQAISGWAKVRDLGVIDLSPEEAGLREVFTKLLQGFNAETVRPFAPFLKQILPGEFGQAPDPERLEESPTLEQARLRDKLAEAFSVLLRGRQVVLLLDDAHRKPEVTEFLGHYLRHYARETSRSADRPPLEKRDRAQLFLLLTARQAEEVHQDLRVDRLIELRSWTVDELRAVLLAVLMIESAPERFARTAWEQTEGVPGRAIEYLRLVLDALPRPGENPEAQLDALSEDDLRRIAHLPTQYEKRYVALADSDRRILQWISISPRELTADDLARLDPLLRVGSSIALRRLQNEGWTAPLRSGFRIASSIRRETVNGTLSPETRRAMHLRFGEILHTIWEGSPLERAGEYMRAGEFQKGYQAAEPELRALLRMGQPAKVLRFLESHLSILERLPPERKETPLRLLAEAHLTAGNFPQAIVLLETLTAERPDGADLSLLLTKAYRYGGRLDEARRTAEKAKPSARDPKVEISFDALLADLLLEQGRYREAAEVSDRYLSESQRYDPEERIAFRHVKAKTHFYNGEYDRAVLLFKQNCAETERADGRLGQRALALNSLATAYLAQGNVEESLRLLHSSSEIAGQIGDLRTLALAQVNLALAFSEKGDAAASSKHYEAGLATFRKIGDQVNEARTLYNMGFLHLQTGDLVQAEEAFAEAIDRARTLNMTHLEATARLQRAECHLQKGSPDRALAECDKAEELCVGAQLRHEMFLVRLKRLEIRMAADPAASDPHDDSSRSPRSDPSSAVAATEGEAERAAPLTGDLDLCEQDLRSSASPELEAWALYLRGRLLSRNTPAVAVQTFEQALKKSEESATSDPALRKKIRLELAALAGDAREPEKPTRPERPKSRPVPGATPAGPSEVISLLQIARKMNTPIDTGDVLTEIVDSMIGFTGADRGFLLLTEGGRLAVRVSRTRDGAQVYDPDRSFSVTVAQEAIEKGEPVMAIDAYDDPRFKQAASIYNLRLRSILCVPLLLEGKALGALYLDSRARAAQFEERHLPVLSALSDLAAATIYKAQLIAQKIKDQKDLRRALQEVKESKGKIEVLAGELREANEELRGRVTEQEQEIQTARHRLEIALKEEQPKYRYDQLVGSSRAWRNVLLMVDRAVDSRVPVLLLGESGTGKELVARAIHFNSARQGKAFVPLNCAAVPSDLFESELFGHVRGAFTGADRDKPGLFEAAQGGTLFLDEIGDLPLSTQPKFLRVLQDKLVRRLGGIREVQVDIRIIAATNQNLAQMVGEGKFREDLYYRLSVFEIPLPPLRERIEDIPALAEHFLREMAREENKPVKKISRPSLRALQQYHWPGNIRELENVVRRGYLFSTGDHVEVTLPGKPGQQQGKGQTERSASRRRGPVSLREALSELRRECIEEALRNKDGNVSAAARQLGVNRTQLTAWIKKLRIHAPRPS